MGCARKLVIVSLPSSAVPEEFWSPRPSDCGIEPNFAGRGLGEGLVLDQDLSCSGDRGWLKGQMLPIVGTGAVGQAGGNQPLQD